MSRNSVRSEALGSYADVSTRLSMREPPARWPVWRTVACTLGILVATPCAADPSSIRGAIEDTKLYFTAPLRWDEGDWLQFGGSLAAIGIAHEYDATVRDHFVSDADVGSKDSNDLRDAAPLAAMVAGTWVAASLWDDQAGFKEGRVMLEAGALAALSTTLFKFAAGRSRPNETTQVDDWRSGGDSFPSMHVSTTFAVGTVLAESGSEDYRWLRRGIGYGLAAATAYGRLDSNAHWLSDTVAGAALGIATAQFAMQRRDQHPGRLALMVVPVEGGLVLTYSLQLE
jgi:PAP2 superfamily